MKEKTCCFTGRREIPIDQYTTIKNLLKKEVTKLIHADVVYFGTGGARGFDALAAQTILELKNEYPYIKLILVLPCRNHTTGWSQHDYQHFLYTANHADKIRILSPTYYHGCMHYRNRHLVDHSSYCICYQRKSVGGTAYTVNYAKQVGVQMIYI